MAVDWSGSSSTHLPRGSTCGILVRRTGAQAYPAPGEEQFTVVRAVEDAPRYHVDIEIDDLAAEVARLTALGAEPMTRWKDAFTLHAPGGNLLCVVPVHSDPETFANSARTWP